MKFDISVLDKYLHSDSKFCKEKHPDADLYIYGYDSRKQVSAIIWDHMNINMRGLVVDGQGNVHAMAFKKFFTFKQYMSPKVIYLSEGATLRLPNEEYIITEKMDGTMGLLYWIDDIPYIATQRSFKAINAIRATEILHKKYSHLFSKLDRNKSYVFEVIFPESRVLVDYGDREDLVLIGVINNETGEEETQQNLGIGFPVPKDYTEEYGHIKNFDELLKLNIPNLEGFVVTYPNAGLKLKLKFEWFEEAHLAMNKIIHISIKIRDARIKFNRIMGHPKQLLSNQVIWQTLKEGKDIEELKVLIPYDYYFHDFENWLHQCLDEMTEKFNQLKEVFPVKSDIEIWEMVKPDYIDYFDIDERINQPHSSSVMWRLIEREKNLFN